MWFIRMHAWFWCLKKTPKYNNIVNAINYKGFIYWHTTHLIKAPLGAFLYSYYVMCLVMAIIFTSVLFLIFTFQQSSGRLAATTGNSTSCPGLSAPPAR